MHSMALFTPHTLSMLTQKPEVEACQLLDFFFTSNTAITSILWKYHLLESFD